MRSHRVFRSIPALILAAAVVAVALTGCSTATTAESSCIVGPGQASESITASGSLGGNLKATIPAPMNATTTERSTLIKGKGPALQAGGTAKFAVTFFDGSTGQQAAATQTVWGTDSKASLQAAGLADALRCVTSGSRVAIVIPDKDGGSTYGATKTSAAVMIIDVSDVVPSRAWGRPVPTKGGFPTVSLAPNGNPGVKIPDNTPAPTTLTSEMLKDGNGKHVTSKDTVLVQVLQVSWDDPTVLESTWKNGVATTLASSSNATALGKALFKEVLGKRVGSQLVVLVPAKDDTTNNEASVVVIDLLGIVS